jgi:oligoendopeptidase F
MSEDVLPDWDISVLVKSTDSESIKREYSEILEQAKQFQTKYKNNIAGLDGKGLRTVIEKYEDLYANILRVRNYCWMNFDVNTNNAGAKALHEFSQGAFAEFEKSLIFLELEIQNLLKKNPGMINDSEVHSYRYYLTKLHEKSIHMFSEDEEQLIIEKNRFGSQAWFQLQNEIRGTTTKTIQIEGEKKTLALMELYLLLNNSPNRNTRMTAAKAFYATLAENQRALSYAYRSICTNYVSEMKRRGWKDELSPTLHLEGLERESITAMFDALSSNTSMMKRYFKLKAKLMGVKKPANIDLMAQAVKADQKIGWKESRDLVVRAYTQFDSFAGAYIDSHFENNRIDARPRPGKSTFGACWVSHLPNLTWIIFNHTGLLFDLMGIAHEGGHAYHSHLSAAKNSFLNWSRGALSLAETASIFGELLFQEEVLSKGDRETKIAVLCNQLDHFRLTTYDMLWRFNFETETYNSIESGIFLDADKICELYTNERTKVFGDSIDCLPESKWSWSFTIHNFIPNYRYYNFAYSFGRLLAYVLYNRYREEGGSFKPSIIKILEAGGSRSTTDILNNVGFDITSKKFWETGVGLAEDILKKLETAIDE